MQSGALLKCLEGLYRHWSGTTQGELQRANITVTNWDGIQHAENRRYPAEKVDVVVLDDLPKVVHDAFSAVPASCPQHHRRPLAPRNQATNDVAVDVKKW